MTIEDDIEKIEAVLAENEPVYIEAKRQVPPELFKEAQEHVRRH